MQTARLPHWIPEFHPWQRSARGDGLIRLGMLRSLGVSFIPQLAARYLASHPEHDVRFTFHTGSTGDLVNGLSARDYDLILCSMPLETESLDTVPITHEDLVLIVPDHHPLAAKQSVALTETLDLSTDLFFPRFRYA